MEYTLPVYAVYTVYMPLCALLRNKGYIWFICRMPSGIRHSRGIGGLRVCNASCCNTLHAVRHGGVNVCMLLYASVRLCSAYMT